MAIQSELNAHFAEVDEIPYPVQAELFSSAAVILGARYLSSEVTLASEAHAGPFIQAVEALRSDSATKDGRDDSDPGTMVLPATLLRGSRSRPDLEDELYSAMDTFEHDGRPPAAKLFIIETTGSNKHILRPDFRPVKRLLKMFNDPERARLMIVGARQDGLRLLRREVHLSAGVDNDGTIRGFEEREAAAKDCNAERVARVAEKFDKFIDSRLTHLEAQKLVLGVNSPARSVGHWVADPSNKN